MNTPVITQLNKVMLSSSIGISVPEGKMLLVTVTVQFLDVWLINDNIHIAPRRYCNWRNCTLLTVRFAKAKAALKKQIFILYEKTFLKKSFIFWAFLRVRSK